MSPEKPAAMDPTILLAAPPLSKLPSQSLLVNVHLIVLPQEIHPLFAEPFPHPPLMIEMAVIEKEAVRFLIEIILRGTENELGIETENAMETEIEIEIEKGREIEIERGIETGRVSVGMIMTEGPEGVEGTMRVVIIVRAGAGAGAGVGVRACTLGVTGLVIGRVQAEKGVRRKYLPHQAIWLN